MHWRLCVCSHPAGLTSCLFWPAAACAVVRWTMWNTIFLVAVVQAHNTNPYWRSGACAASERPQRGISHSSVSEWDGGGCMIACSGSACLSRGLPVHALVVGCKLSDRVARQGCLTRHAACSLQRTLLGMAAPPSGSGERQSPPTRPSGRAACKHRNATTRACEGTMRALL